MTLYEKMQAFYKAMTAQASKARAIIYRDLEFPGPYYVQLIPANSVEEMPEQ